MMLNDIPGEYATVVRASRRPDLLRRAHQIGLQKYQALALAEHLIAHDGFERIDVQFSQSTRSYCRQHKDGWITITLASVPLNGVPGVGLRLGLVVHEFAHGVLLVRGLHKEERDHGSEFTAVMDEILQRLEKGGLPGPWLAGLSLTENQPAYVEEGVAA